MRFRITDFRTRSSVPRANRARAWHCTTTRRSQPGIKARSTNYRARPEDGAMKSGLIWMDKQAVDLYSRAKARFGFSDAFASKILGFLSRKR